MPNISSDAGTRGFEPGPRAGLPHGFVHFAAFAEPRELEGAPDTSVDDQRIKSMKMRFMMICPILALEMVGLLMAHVSVVCDEVDVDERDNLD